MKIKSFECPKSIRNCKKDNAWNIRCLVDESFVQSNQRTSLLYCRFRISEQCGAGARAKALFKSDGAEPISSEASRATRNFLIYFTSVLF